MNEYNAIGRDTALLHLFFRENPDDWDDEKFAKMRARLNYALTVMAKTNSLI